MVPLWGSAGPGSYGALFESRTPRPCASQVLAEAHHSEIQDAQLPLRARRTDTYICVYIYMYICKYVYVCIYVYL